MSLATRCIHNFSLTTRSRGLSYFRAHAVRLDIADTAGASFLVQGSEAQPYEVELEWEGSSPDSIRATCTCPYYSSEGLCKHIWAALLQSDESNLSKFVLGNSPLEVELNEIDDYWDQLDDDSSEGPSPAVVDGLSFPSRTASPTDTRKGANNPQKTPLANSWRGPMKALTESLRGAPTSHSLPPDAAESPLEAWYVLDLDGIRRWGLPVIVFYQRTTKRNGEFGKIKKTHLCRKEIPKFTTAEDRQLLDLLLGVDSNGLENVFSSWYSGGDYQGTEYTKHAQGTIVQAFFGEVLPRLCATGRFVWVQNTLGKPEIETAPKLSWDAGPAWKPRLRVVEEPDGKRFRVVGEFYRNDEVLPLAAPVLVMRTGLMILPDRIGLVDPEDCFEWIIWLRQHPDVTIPKEEEADFISQLWSLPRLPELQLPDAMQWEQLRLPPTGSIRIKRAKNSSKFMDDLYANVTFRYGDQAASYSTPQSAIIDATNRRIVVRDAVGERRLVAQLRSAGFDNPRHHYYHKPEGEFSLPAKKLGKAVDQLLAIGWDVEAEGQLIRRPGDIKMRVTSTVDWFGLTAEIDFDGVSATLPELLAAMSRGEKYVQLDDGTKGMLPEQWLAKYSGLLDMGMGESEDGVMKFAPSQAMLLDALLAAQEQDHVSVDRRFEQYRQKLKGFEGVAPAKAPTTFKGELRHYQEEGLGWLHFLREFGFGGCLADDMGLGKTVQVLALLDARRTRKVATGESRVPSLVVVPRSLVFNWAEEAERFAPKLRLLNYSNGQRSEFQDQLSDYDVIVTTYGILRRDIAQLKDLRFDYAILDEAQAVKNEQSQAAKACRLIQADHRLAMTGTPVENHLGELWSLFEFLNPGMLGRSAMFASFVKSTSSKMSSPITEANEPVSIEDENGAAAKIAEGERESGQRQSLSVLANAIRPFILRRTKQQVLTELPERTEQTLYCEMEPKQRKLYEELRDYYRQSLAQRVEKNGLAKSKIHVLEALLRLRQAACHPGLLDKEKIAEPSAKLETLLEQLDELVSENHKALVFSQFTSLLDIVRKQLDKRKITYEYLDGKTRDRKGPVDRFQNDPDCPLFLISLKAGGQGLNLTAADYVFILDPWWNPAVEAQAIDRAYRIGQTRRVFAYRLICKGTVEDKILELQKSKRELAEAIITADNSLIRSLTTEDLQMLLS